MFPVCDPIAWLTVMRQLLVVIIAVACLFSATTTADTGSGLRLEPAQACDLLADQGLRTRGFRADTDEFSCRSQRRALSGGGQPRHTVRYRALGTQGSVDHLVLELQINSNNAVQRAHGQFVDRARVVFRRALDKALPAEVEAAILGAVAGSWPVNGNRVTLERITAGSPHYALRLSIE